MIPATWRSSGFDDPDRPQYLWDGLHNGYTERGKLASGIERGIPLNIPSFLWPERRVWLLALEQEYRAAGHDILARYCREEIKRHDARHGCGVADQTNHG